jgi:diguanylate cyclase (GGDEF)-like protein
LVASAIAQILIVVVLLVGLLIAGARNSSAASDTSRRANTASSIAADLEAVGLANVQLQSAFERAVATEPAGARAAQFSTASSTGIIGTGAFSTYRQRAIGLPREAAARQAYEDATDAWNKLAGQFGPALVSASTPPQVVALSIERLRILQDAREGRLADLRELYLAEASHDQLLVIKREGNIARVADWATAVVLAMGLALIIVAARRAARRVKERTRNERERATRERQTDFEARLQRSMALSVNEAAVLESVAHTLDVVGFPSAELLVAENDTADFVRVIAPHVGDGCGVTRAADCPAVRLRQRLDFVDSDAIDACPFVRRRHAQVGQCVCVPITIDDQTLGVLRTESVVGESLPVEQGNWITILARNLAERTNSLRVFAHSQLEAATDPLTRLANRRTLELAIGAGMDSETYAVVFADLDHFKDLNDTYGHDAGDECLRAFARVLERSTRPGDLNARYGGEEFVVLLPGATRDDARAVAERIQTLLVDELAGAHLAPFTVSIGIAATDHAESIGEVIRAADHAMYDAKTAGRDRIVTARA